MEIIIVSPYLNSRVAVTTDKMAFRAMEDSGVGRELSETYLEIKNSQMKES